MVTQITAEKFMFQKTTKKLREYISCVADDQKAEPALYALHHLVRSRTEDEYVERMKRAFSPVTNEKKIENGHHRHRGMMMALRNLSRMPIGDVAIITGAGYLHSASLNRTALNAYQRVLVEMDRAGTPFY